MDHTGYWIIYPSYIDSSKTIKEGRRIGSELAVPIPTVNDISHALQSLHIKHVIQPYKGYPRDTPTLWENPGRVKVEPTTTTTDNNTTSGKRRLMIEIASIIPTLPGRIQRLEQEAVNKAMEETKKQERQQQQQLKTQKQQQHKGNTKGTTTTASSTSTTNAKKKGKKKR